MATVDRASLSRSIHWYLVAYDVTLPKRGRRLFRLLKRVGDWIQFSAFLCCLTSQQKARLEARMKAIVDPAEDRLLIVDLGEEDAARLRTTAVGEIFLPAKPSAIFI